MLKLTIEDDGNTAALVVQINGKVITDWDSLGRNEQVKIVNIFAKFYGMFYPHIKPKEQ